VLGLSEIGLAINIVVFAVTTAIVAVLVGAAMQRRGWSADFMIKLRLVFSVLLVQTRLTALAPGISGEPLLLAWIVASALAMGIGTPATFGLTVDLVPVRARGSAAALITAVAFTPAAILSSDWRIETFASQLVPLMLLGALTLGPLPGDDFSWSSDWAYQPEQGRPY
jgi:hypothetical protein